MGSLIQLNGKPRCLTGLTHLEVGMEGNIKLSVNFKQFLAFQTKSNIPSK
jgi:hypothetical protein